MFGSRDEIRQVYLNVWQKLQQKQLLEPMEALIADVIESHPEYQALLADNADIKQQEFTPEQGQTNPFLHMGMHIALREQAGTDRPSGIKSIYQRLVTAKGQHQAEHAMMECLGQALWNAQRNAQPPDETDYLDCLKKL
ncbi:MAG: DUF1841 family protein [Gammaproteobacteria bacterium]|nr:DUF1841 family protein [Gammaproteobacteria bacterium]